MLRTLSLIAMLFVASPLHAQISGIPIGPGSGSGGGGSGTVTSISAGCGSSTGGSAITTSGTIAASEPVSLHTGANYAILSTDCGTLVNLSNAGAQAPTIAAATTTGFGAGTYWDVCNIAAGTQTITPTTSTIGGAASKALTNGQCIRIVSDGTNYLVAGTGLSSSVTTPLTLPAAPAANTTTDGLILTDTTAASSGNQQYSPSLHLTGQGWKTTATAGSQATDWIVVNQPVQGTTNPSTTLVFSSSVNGGGFSQQFVVGSDGTWQGQDSNSTLKLSGGFLTWKSFGNTGFSVGSNAATIGSGGVGSQLGLGTSTTVLLTNEGNNILQMGAGDAAAAVAQTLQVQSVVAGTSNTAGANWTIIGSKSTGTGVGGNIILQVAKTGTTGTTVNSAFPMLTLNAGGAATATVQFGDGTNFTTYDSCTGLTTGATGVIACTASAMRFKNPLGTVVATDLSDLHPASWTYKEPERFGEGEFVGLYADDVERMDSRCVTHDSDGQLKDYRDRCVIAHLVAVAQKQQEEIEILKKRQ